MGNQYNKITTEIIFIKTTCSEEGQYRLKLDALLLKKRKKINAIKIRVKT